MVCHTLVCFRDRGRRLGHYDEYRVNTAVNAALKWAWPIIVFFFSVIGLWLYIRTCRPPEIGKIEEPEKKKKVHHEYVDTQVRKVTGSVIHCVGGDGLGIITAMAGMGAIMGFITPLVVGEQPKPYTMAFWGFGVLGLMVGFVTTFPMNWILVKIGWKHGPERRMCHQPCLPHFSIDAYFLPNLRDKSL